MKRQGFISFILAAVFLFSIIPAAALISGQQPDLSFEGFRALLAQEIAVKQAFYRSSESSSRAACAAAVAAGVPPDEAIRAALLANAVRLQSDLQSEGYDAQFWCGAPDSWALETLGIKVPSQISEQMRKDASKEMMESGRAISPQGTLPVEFCLASFQSGLNGTKGSAQFASLGFSLYDKKSGFGKAVVFPFQRGVEFGCP